GVTYAANLTPDKNTGLGIWTEEMFVGAVRTGKHWGQSGARPIQPPMPWQALSRMTDEDLKSVWAYLRTIPAIRNAVPDYVTPE
ncbi:MAG: cytochrome c, partial [Phycisphaerae bacterium]